MKYKSYTDEQIQKAKELYSNKIPVLRIAKLVDATRGAVKYWVEKNFDIKYGADYERKNGEIIFNPSDYFHSEELQKAYSYTLAVYLCDGHIIEVASKRTHLLRLFNDIKYPNDSLEWKNNLQKILPNNVCNQYNPKNRNIFLTTIHSCLLPNLFPQHGKGEKHNRKLVLQDWQKEIITKYPKEFIRGCIQSDGCVYIHKQGMREYKKHAFVNKSEDIVEFFLYTLSLVGIKKEKWKSKTGIFRVQNFGKQGEQILNSIIPFKH